MSSNGPDQPPEDPQESGPRPERARQLFGSKGGGKPWDSPRSGERAGQNTPAPTARSAPYPDAPQYAPRAAASTEPEAVGEDDALTLLHPNYKLLMRIAGIIVALVIFAAGTAIDAILHNEAGLPFGIVMVPATLLALYIAFPLPSRRYRNRGYQISDDRLRVVRGVMWHSDTVVPFGRVQHIDVDQGPVERALGIATLTLHTAGSHNASVSLPGLGHELAVEMRETIRAHIKRESM